MQLFIWQQLLRSTRHFTKLQLSTVQADGQNQACYTPGIKPTIIILLLMNVGNVLNAGFEVQYLLGNGLVQKVSQTIDIYVLKWGISQGDFAIGTAAGIFKSFVSIILIVIANQIAKRNGEEQLF